MWSKQQLKKYRHTMEAKKKLIANQVLTLSPAGRVESLTDDFLGGPDGSREAGDHDLGREG